MGKWGNLACKRLCEDLGIDRNIGLIEILEKQKIEFWAEFIQLSYFFVKGGNFVD
jgi:hypothetical protein